MADLSVELSSISGFTTDLGELATSSATNVARLLSAVVLPVGSTGLLATLAPSVEKFRSAAASAFDAETAAIGDFRTNLSSVVARFGSTDETNAAAISAASIDLGAGGAQHALGAGYGVSRFGGLQLPSLPAVSEHPYIVRQVVESVIGLISVYDERLSAAIGVKPAADLLSSLVADWESLQAIGKRIGLLGINDYVTSENLVNGTRWLQGSWSGAAAESFGASSNDLAQAVAARSLDFESVSKVLENGSAYLERLVYNQAASLCETVLQPMTFLGATFPLGAWAPHINNPIDGTMRAKIVTSLDSLEASAVSRQQQIQAMVDKISEALDYAPGRSMPTFNSSEFDLPERIAMDLGARKFGYGDNVWWEDRVDSIF
ncbi:hypothetical protein [Nocardia mangyaensis]|uniref:hypothetical protein n=1 Tax=Nocardia mangyaensis TaxID=2213200 RepID=UPI002675A950|nr:hypothetical protein [Nocardia mangyaensis]MDO3648735.1 hypothetical protein [Nocardia mangyaensis]